MNPRLDSAPAIGPGGMRLFLCLFAIATLTAGCGLFDTAQPIPPTDDAQVPPPDFTLPESTLVTLERAVENRLNSNYAQCLTDSVGNAEPGFYASFDPSDLAAWLQNGNPNPGTWTRERELVFLPGFLAFNPNALYSVTFSPDPLRPDFDISADTKVWNRRYRVFAAGSPVAAGSAGLTFKRVGLSGEWKIRVWEDRRDTTNVRTWGTARLTGR